MYLIEIRRFVLLHKCISIAIPAQFYTNENAAAEKSYFLLNFSHAIFFLGVFHSKYQIWQLAIYQATVILIQEVYWTFGRFDRVIIHLPLAHFPPTILTHFPPVNEPFPPYV